MPVQVLVLSKFGISESDFFTIVYIRFFQAVWPAARGGSSDRLAVWTTEQYDCNTAAHTAGQTAPWLRGLVYPRLARCCQPLCWRRNTSPRNDLFAKRNFSPCMSLSLSFCMAERVDRRDDGRQHQTSGPCCSLSKLLRTVRNDCRFCNKFIIDSWGRLWPGHPAGRAIGAPSPAITTIFL